MSELHCNNPECRRVIQTATAARTNGLCMPCHRSAEQKAREEYIRKNRRDVNPFDGVTDRVEIIKLIHTPHRHDPLTNWIPYPTPIDELYRELNHEEQVRLANYAVSRVGEDRIAETISLCLAAFTETNLDECLRAFTCCNLFWPSLPFHRSPADVRDELIRKVEREECNRNHVLLALAWIGDVEVVQLFNRWRSKPPDWSHSLYIPPHEYSYEAGWELTNLGDRRDLFYKECTSLKEHLPLRDTFAALTDNGGVCRWCGRPLTNLVDVVLREFGMLTAEEQIGRVRVVTCEICSIFGPGFGSFDDEGSGIWSLANAPEFSPSDSMNHTLLPQNTLSVGERRPPFWAADEFLPTTFSQLGGHPTWIQDAAYPKCPKCVQTMMFLCQIDESDIEGAGEGIHYGFLCPQCRTTAASYQCS